MGHDRVHIGMATIVLHIVVLSVVCFPPPARADIDPNGSWSVTVAESFFGPVTVAVGFRRSGATLDAHVENLGTWPFGAFPSHLTGSIDPVSGAFAVSGDSACIGALGAAPQTISGTFGPGGDAFTGTADLDFLLGAPLKCFRATGSASGTRTSVTCGNGTLDGGEACDFDPSVACCTVDCQPLAAGSPCTLSDALCSLLPATCGGCAVGSCDGAGACTQAPRPAGTTCRPAAGACDIAETCDGVGLVCPPDEVVPPPDTDGDGLNDGCDPCTGGAPASKPRLTATRLTSHVASGDRLKVRGTMSLQALAQLDPTVTGLRLVVDDGAGLRHVDATAPGGSGWKAARNGWSFRGEGAITSIKLKRVASSPAALVLSLRGRGTWSTGPPPESNLPLEATVVLDPPFAATGQCAELVFPGPPRVQPACTLQRSGSSVTCR
jgi:hypothetical protein